MALPSKLGNLNDQVFKTPVSLKGFLHNMDISEDEVKIKAYGEDRGDAR